MQQQMIKTALDQLGLQAKHNKLHPDNEEVNENEMRCMCSLGFGDNGTFLVHFWVKSPCKNQSTGGHDTSWLLLPVAMDPSASIELVLAGPTIVIHSSISLR